MPQPPGEAPPQTLAQPPGWYADPQLPGMQRWWDGTKWTDQTAPGATAANPSDSRTMAMLAHLLPIVTGFLGPLVIYLMKKDDDPYVRDQAAESLNFSLTLIIAYLISAILILVVIGIFLMIAIWICALIFHILGGMAASRGDSYRYPINIRMVH